MSRKAGYSKVAMFYSVRYWWVLLAPFSDVVNPLKPDNEIFIYPPRWLPMQVTFEIQKGLEAVPLVGIFSMCIRGFIQLFSGFLVPCCLWIRKNVFLVGCNFMAVLGTMMVPMQVL